ncbi:MAG: sensor histidine kinase, partial [Candidatus Thermoplasmatota archaeon]
MNSIKHSGGKRILVSTKSKDDELVCTVEDDGKGVPDEAKEKIFERGYKKGETGVSGVGLYMVKEIAESYG